MLLLWPDASVLILRYTQFSPAPPVHLSTTVVLSMSQEIQNFTDYKANNRQTQKVVFSRRRSGKAHSSAQCWLLNTWHLFPRY